MSASRYAKSPNKPRTKSKKKKPKLTAPKFSKPKFAIFLSSLLILLLVPTAVMFTIAYQTDTTDKFINEFIPKEVVIEIQENFDGAKKENVAVQNTGDVPAYIRFKLSVSAVDEKGNHIIHPVRKVNTSNTVADLTFRAIELSDFVITAPDWADEFFYDNINDVYYCKTLVPVGDTVSVFDKATCSLKIFDPTAKELPLPLMDSDGNPYYVFNSEGKILARYNEKTEEYKSFSQEEMSANGYTSVLDEEGTFTYMLSSYNPTLTITAESIQAEGVVDAWDVALDDNGNIIGLAPPAPLAPTE